jgi:hypothetical protein
VFLGHGAKDKTVVRDFSARLKADGVRFKDKRDSGKARWDVMLECGAP